jgi:hypothetical protein
MPDTALSIIPRLDDETPRAHAAKVAYVTAGPGRSLDKLRQQIGNRSVRYLEQWSARFDWAATARAWDDQQAAAVARDASDAYRADLEAHRKVSMDTGKVLHAVASNLLSQVNNALTSPRRIEGKDGKWYTLHGVELTSNSLAVASRAMLAALDLQAHALGVDRILTGLTDDSEQ